MVLQIRNERCGGQIPRGLSLCNAFVLHVLASPGKALRKGARKQVDATCEVRIVPMAFAGRYGVQAMVYVVRPLCGIEPGRAVIAPCQPACLVQRVFCDEMNMPAIGRAADLLRKVLKQVLGSAI